ncbi:hypothetical protein [Aeromonas rivipollensis]|uniref:hypothetical protein n=1 Tax=Aeromonas rivipollensis TaxID=948519 RepID=UPI003D24DE0F
MNVTKMPINKNSKTSFGLEGNSIYVCQVSTHNVEKFSAPRLIGQSNFGKVLLKRDITKNDENLSTVFYTGDNDSIVNFSVRFNHKVEELSSSKIIKTIAVKKVGSRQDYKLITKSDTICAAIASYPARKTSLIEAIESLVEQVDYLLLYLNEYTYIPEEIIRHKSRNKIICIVDEDGSRRAEGKFHWLHRVNGYYLTCDDDIIYPEDYVQRTVQSIELFRRTSVVGYHGLIFNNSVASFKADRKEFYRFTDKLESTRHCHLLGTGVTGFHSDLFKTTDTQLLRCYPFAVDPAFAVICKKNKIDMICLSHEENWLKSSPHMLHGLYEEKQAFPEKRDAVDSLLQRHNPWNGGVTSIIMAKIKSNPKLRKLINNPRKFLLDSKAFGIFINNKHGK